MVYLPKELTSIILEYVGKDVWDSDNYWNRHQEEIDWEKMSQNIGMPRQFWEHHIDKIDWSDFSALQDYHINFWEKHKKLIDVWGIYQNPNIDVKFLLENLSELRHKCNTIPFFVCLCTKIPVEFWEKNIKDINWFYISQNSKISLIFIEKHINKFNYSMLSANLDAPIEFWENHIELIDWDSLCSNPFITDETFWKRHIANVYIDKLSVRTHPLSNDFWNWYKNEVDSKYETIKIKSYLEDSINEKKWKLSNDCENLVKCNKDEIDWYNFSQNPHIYAWEIQRKLKWIFNDEIFI